jgi:outer membrane protein assembly factor BamB
MARRSQVPRWILVAVAATTLSLTSASLAAAAAGDWTMWGDGPAHNSVNRAETTLSPATVSGLRVVKTYPNWDPSIFSTESPYQLIVGNVGYSVVGGPFLVNTYITAFNVFTGAVIWRHRVSINNNSGHYVPAYSNGVIYIGGDSAMSAYNATNGTKVWIHYVPVGSIFNQTTVVGGDVYATTSHGGTIYDFNAMNGSVRWKRSPTPGGCCLFGAVAVAGGVAYVLNDALYAYGASSGVLKFKTTPNNYFETPVVSNGVVYMTTNTNVIARSASTGGLLWSTRATGTGDVTNSTVAVDGATVVVATSRYLEAFRASTGTRIWRVDGGSDSSDYAVPAIANGVVYAGSIGNGLQAVNEATGHNYFTSHHPYCQSPVISHARVWASCLESQGAEQEIAFGL